MEELKKIQQKLSSHWSQIDTATLVNDVTRSLMQDRGDWDPPVGVEPKLKTIPLSIGIPDTESLPKEALRQSANRIFSRPGEAAFVYGFGMGYRRLRAQLAEMYSNERGMQVTDDWFQLCNGSSGAIDLIGRTLVQPGDVIISESPTYMGTLRNFRALQADVQSVPMDQDGLITSELETLIKRLLENGKQIKFIYTISTFQNPTGATLATDRRIELLRIAAKYKILILDDDAYGSLYFESKPPPPLSALSAGHGVLTVGTFSKILATGLRIGWIHGTPDLVALFGKMRFAMGLNQQMARTVSDYIAAGNLNSHADSVRSIYRNKMETLADALTQHAGEFVQFTRPKGGFYLWVNLTNSLRTQDVWRTGAEEGVAFTRGVNFYPSRVDPDEHIRIAFSWTRLDEIEEAAIRFGRACRRVAAGDGASD